MKRKTAQKELDRLSEEFIVGFVYGTLRVSDGHTGWARGYIPDMTIENATTSGKMWPVGGYGGGYPVCDLTADGTIIGDVLFWHKDDPAGWHGICRVELGAGYEEREVDCLVTYKGYDDLLIRARGWHYEVTDPRRTGTYQDSNRIKGGDWVRYEQFELDFWGR